MVTERQPQTHAGPDRGRPLVRALMIFAAGWLVLTVALFVARQVELYALFGALFLFAMSASAVSLTPLSKRATRVVFGLRIASLAAGLVVVTYGLFFSEPPDGVTPIEDAVFAGTTVMIVLVLVGLVLQRRVDDGR